ncbi:hypothetical protein [Chakrabartyella piscis]|uniref:hypothetical protein n=1 Tax=Chakrabartyella piscis TaxID=2918914 RepID=UPI0029585B41|nr:hypothetical protein [Chakrabartyella piscis]
MDWNRKTLSPNELNKYTYCPYQWYYERFYGRAELTRLRKERNEALHLEDTTVSHFARGEKHHNRLYGKLQWRSRLQKLCLLVILVCVVGLCVYYGVMQ